MTLYATPDDHLEQARHAQKLWMRFEKAGEQAKADFWRAIWSQKLHDARECGDEFDLRVKARRSARLLSEGVRHEQTGLGTDVLRHRDDRGDGEVHRDRDGMRDGPQATRSTGTGIRSE